MLAVLGAGQGDRPGNTCMRDVVTMRSSLPNVGNRGAEDKNKHRTTHPDMKHFLLNLLASGPAATGWAKQGEHGIPLGTWLMLAAELMQRSIFLRETLLVFLYRWKMGANDLHPATAYFILSEVRRKFVSCPPPCRISQCIFSKWAIPKGNIFPT